MSKLRDIEQAVQQLPQTELAEFRAWFAHFDDAYWDMRLEKDMASGALDNLLAEAKKAAESGAVKPL